ncbi:MAG: glycosyltransferase family 2 protein [bacterium]|nr:glycosyltransferase family 2 protein [bacterium]
MKLSVVIPCRNEAPYIEECLHAIYASDISDQVEMSVFVVDGMSDDGTRDKVQAFKDSYPSLQLVDNEKQLTPYAFNLGIYAGGKVDFVQIIGARHIISSNYLSKCLEHLQRDERIWCVGGRIQNEYLNTTGEIISIAMGTAFGMGLGNFRTLTKSGFTDTVTSPMYPYWVFEKIGFFDETLVRNQDDDFNFRVEKAGGKVYYEHDISLKYYVRGNFEGLRRQFFQYGYWKVFVNRKHKAVTTVRQLVPPLFVLYLMLLPITAILGVESLLLACVPLILYLILLSYFSFSAMKSPKQLGPIMQTYLTLHLSYGFGYLRGIIEFLLLRKDPSDRQKRMSR